MKMKANQILAIGFAICALGAAIVTFFVRQESQTGILAGSKVIPGFVVMFAGAYVIFHAKKRAAKEK